MYKTCPSKGEHVVGTGIALGKQIENKTKVMFKGLVLAHASFSCEDGKMASVYYYLRSRKG